MQSENASGFLQPASGSRALPPPAELPSILSTGDSGEQLTDNLRNMIHTAVVQMQGDLKDELNEEDITIHGVLGQGAFGTVYHGVQRACYHGLCSILCVQNVAMQAVARAHPSCCNSVSPLHPRVWRCMPSSAICVSRNLVHWKKWCCR